MTLEKFQDNSRNACNFEIKLEDLKKFDIQVILKFNSNYNIYYYILSISVDIIRLSLLRMKNFKSLIVQLVRLSTIVACSINR